MNEKERAEQRFFQPAAGIHVYFRPQCTTCKLNLDYYTCRAFKEKPPGYMTNEIECPVRRPLS